MDGLPSGRAARGILTTTSASTLNAQETKMVQPLDGCPMPTTETRTDRGVLTTTSASSLNARDSQSLLSKKKRKRDDDDTASGSWRSFTIKPYPSPILDKARNLIPVLTLPRSKLPLAYLDTNPRTSALPPARLFSADISCLESPPPSVSGGRKSDPAVLVARLEVDGTLYAVERVRRGIYALCKIGAWVTFEELRNVSSFVVPKQTQCSTGMMAKGDGCKPSTSQSVVKKMEAKRRKVEDDEVSQQTVPRPEEPSLEQIIQPASIQTPSQLMAELPSQLPIPETVESPSMIPEVDPREIYTMVQTQYLEALYLSKTSLAYFAKGPLSRARAALSSDGSSSDTSTGLVKFLESAVLNPRLMDKKYRETLPTVVEALSPLGASDDDTGSKPKRKSKKLGPAKDGMYAHEKEYVVKWWDADEEELGSMSVDETRESRTKRKLTALRLRETKLQVILILEVLSLQASMKQGVDAPKVVSPKEDENRRDKAKSSRKKKKTPELSLTLELLLDRLCIWQTVNVEGPMSVSRPISRHGGFNGKSTGLSTDSDDLRDFCTEVVVPFYGARLPEQCAAINRKLGGPSVPSPVRPSLKDKKRHSDSARRRGGVTKRTVAAKPQRTLERVLTDDRIAQAAASRRSSVIPSLKRSATAPAAPRLKREGTGTPVPGRDTPAPPPSRGGVMDTRRLSQREVEIHRAETKRRKQAAVEEQLKGAITALKKPNRSLAVRDYAESCDRRVLSSTSQVRKPAGVTAARGIQVEATPKGGRTTNVAINATPFALARQATTLPLPAQSDMCIPSSAVRPPPVAIFPERENPLQETPQRARRFHNIDSRIDDTPCRRGSKMGIITAERTQPVPSRPVEKEQAPPISPSTPSPSRIVTQERESNTPSNSNSKSKTKTPQPVFQTPVKQIRLSTVSARGQW
ncbi:MAG: hypothetical protein M1823_004687 [Watsoniomyces obsoletus]|nr:MAG: hypothetical protein M1823_004687 [Watsoniomyces obsoletus]